MKTKVFKSDVLDVADKGIVTISISKFNNKDMGGDIVRKGAFLKTFNEGANRIKHLVDHTLKYAGVVGVPVKMYETDTHAVVESALNLEKQVARDLFSDYKFFNAHGKTLEHSYGYDTIKGKPLEKSAEEILELKMYEYSTVFYGMNPETGLIDIKSADVNVEHLEEYLRKFDVSNKRGREIESIIKQIKALKETKTEKSFLQNFDSQTSDDARTTTSGDNLFMLDGFKLNLKEMAL